ncbi:hypothetical protein LINGRAHAP2_LOCUS24971 [Linum grandiflorum]
MMRKVENKLRKAVEKQSCDRVKNTAFEAIFPEFKNTYATEDLREHELIFLISRKPANKLMQFERCNITELIQFLFLAVGITISWNAAFFGSGLKHSVLLISQHLSNKRQAMGVPDEPLMMGTPGFDLISLGLVDANKIPKYELTVEDGRRLAKDYSRILMRKHRARQVAETNLLRTKKEAIEPLPDKLK